MDLPTVIANHTAEISLYKQLRLLPSLPKESDLIVTHRSFSFKHIILCSIIYDFTMFIFCIYVSTIQFMFLTELKFSSCARAFVHPLFYFLCIGYASTRFKMFSEALPKEFNVKSELLFLFTLFSIVYTASYLILFCWGADKTCL